MGNRVSGGGGAVCPVSLMGHHSGDRYLVHLGEFTVEADGRFDGRVLTPVLRAEVAC